MKERIEHKIVLVGLTKLDNWQCYKYLVTIGGENFDYHVGIGYAVDKKISGFILDR